VEARTRQLPTERTNVLVVGAKLDLPEWHGFVSHRLPVRTTIVACSLRQSAHRRIPTTELQRSIGASTRDSSITKTEPRARARMMDAGRFWINRIYEWGCCGWMDDGRKQHFLSLYFISFSLSELHEHNPRMDLIRGRFVLALGFFFSTIPGFCLEWLYDCRN